MNTMRADTVHPRRLRLLPPAAPAPTAKRRTRTYLFIYKVRHRQQPADVETGRYCTVLALGRDQREAEWIAINCVHQHGWHILRTDTATELPPAYRADGELDAVLLGDLETFGASFRLNR